MARMSELSEMSKYYVRATRHATIHPVFEKSKMTKMPDMTTRHVVRGLGEVTV
jgi:hypothetical protein